MACATGSAAVVEVLLAAGADPSCQDSHGRTPALEAMCGGHDAVVAAVLGHPGAVEECAHHEVIAAAAERGRATTIDLALSAAAGEADGGERSGGAAALFPDAAALEAAAGGSHEATAAVLIRHGAPPSRLAAQIFLAAGLEATSAAIDPGPAAEKAEALAKQIADATREERHRAVRKAEKERRELKRKEKKRKKRIFPPVSVSVPRFVGKIGGMFTNPIGSGLMAIRWRRKAQAERLEEEKKAKAAVSKAAGAAGKWRRKAARAAAHPQ